MQAQHLSAVLQTKSLVKHRRLHQKSMLPLLATASRETNWGKLKLCDAQYINEQMHKRRCSERQNLQLLLYV